jgi:hypothetical protein
MAYRKSAVEIDEAYQNYNEINEIYNFMRESKIKIIKYNNTFDSTVQNLSSYEGFMQIEDGYLNLFLKKPQEKPKFVLEADPKVIQEAKELHRNNME